VRSLEGLDDRSGQGDGGGERRWVDHVGDGREIDVHPCRFGMRTVLGIGSGVGGEIGGVVELCGVDEHRQHDEVVVRPGASEEFEMALVQRPHGGYEADRAGAVCFKGAAKGADRVDDEHRASPYGETCFVDARLGESLGCCDQGVEQRQ